MAHLERLDFSGNRLCPEGAATLAACAESGGLGRLNTLFLDQSGITRGMPELGCLTRVSHLILDD